MKSLEIPEGTAPAVILVEPQLAENIGMTARAMANFGLSELRLVNPKNGWPKKGVREAASGATHVLDGAKIYPDVAAAIADLNHVLATTARERGQMKRVLAPEAAQLPADASGDWFGAGTGWGYGERINVTCAEQDAAMLPHAEDLLALARFAFERGEAIAADQAAPVYLRDKVAQTKAERGII